MEKIKFLAVKRIDTYVKKYGCEESLELLSTDIKKYDGENLIEIPLGCEDEIMEFLLYLKENYENLYYYLLKWLRIDYETLQWYGITL